MAKKAIIRLGDKTSHDGVVLEAFENFNVYGKPAAGIGHRGHCPKCKKDFVIVAGAETASYFGKAVALEGMKTSCGAVLIASQQEATVDVESGSAAQSTSTASAVARSALAAGGASQAAASQTKTQQYNDRFQLVDEDTGEVLGNVRYAVLRESGELEHGTTDSQGYTTVLSNTDSAEEVHVYAENADTPDAMSKESAYA